MKKLIILKATCALGNRLRAIVSALQLSSETGYDFRVEWPLNPDCNCQLESIIDIRGLNIDIKNKKDSYYNRKKDQILRLIQYQKIFFIDEPSAIEIHQNISKSKNSIKERNILKNKIKTHSKIIIHSGRAFYASDDSDYYPKIKPSQTILKNIDNRINKETIGIHIRRGDNKDSIENSPTSKFIEQIEEELELNPHAIFYLSTNDPETENHLESIFKEKLIITKKTSLDRNSTNGIMEAAVDLFSLSKFQKIIGSYWSSFSKMAALIGEIDLEVIRTNIEDENSTSHN